MIQNTERESDHGDQLSGRPFPAGDHSDGCTCSGLRTVKLGLANKDVCGLVLCANTSARGLTFIANEPTLMCKGLANTPVGQHAVRTG